MRYSESYDFTAWNVLSSGEYGTFSSIPHCGDGRFSADGQFPDGVLVPIHARMVSVQPIQTLPELAPPSEMVCTIQ
jgi:hypothetical protein